MEILKEMGIPDHLTSLLRNLYAGQEATVRTGHGTDWFQIGKGVRQGCAVQGTLKNLLQHHSLKARILHRSAFFTVQLSHPYMTTEKTSSFTRGFVAMLAFLYLC